jgi:hypothetical protein
MLGLLVNLFAMIYKLSINVGTIKSVGSKSLKTLPNVPIGVRTADVITTALIIYSPYFHCMNHYCAV